MISKSSTIPSQLGFVLLAYDVSSGVFVNAGRKRDVQERSPRPVAVSVAVREALYMGIVSYPRIRDSDPGQGSN